MLRLGTSGVEPSCRSTSGVFGLTGRNSRYRAITPICAPPCLEDAKERGNRTHRLQARDSRARFLQARVLGGVCGDHKLGRLLLDPRVLLYEARDADAFLRKNLAHSRQHAGAVLGTDAVVGARHHLAHGNDADAIIEGERRTVLNAAPYRPREVDEVADHRGCGRPPTRALAFEQHPSDEVALDEHRVVRAFDLRQRMVERHQRGMHPSLDAAAVPLRIRHELDGIAELARVAEVDGFDALDALAVDVRRPDADLVGDGAEDRELVGGVEALDVVRRVGLRVTGHLRFFDRGLEWQSVGAHSSEHVVGGAVDDRRQTLDAVGLQVCAEGADQWNAAADRGLEVDVYVLLRRERQQLHAVVGHYDLVGGDHVLAGADRPFQERVHRLVAAGDLDDDLDAPVFQQQVRVVGEQPGLDLHRPWLVDVANQDPPEAQLEPCPAGQLRLACDQPLGDLGADRAEADQANVQGGRCHGDGILPAVTRILREADVERVIDMDAVIGAVAAAMRELGEGMAQNEPRRRAFATGGLLNVMFATYPGGGSMGLKAYTVAAGKVRFLVTVFGLDGDLRALIEAETMGAYRTGAASAVAARLLAPSGPLKVGLIGTGRQAQTQALAVSRVLEIAELRVFGRDQARREAFAAAQSAALGIKVVAAPSAEAAVRDADVVVTMTTSATPVFDASWVRSPALVIGAGSNFSNRSELPPELVSRA